MTRYRLYKISINKPCWGMLVDETDESGQITKCPDRYCTTATMEDVAFTVTDREAGRPWAWAESSSVTIDAPDPGRHLYRVTYYPHKEASFVRTDTGEPIDHAALVYADTLGRLWVVET